MHTKNYLLNSMLITSMLFSSKLNAQCSCSSTYTINASTSNLNINNGETWCLSSGSYSGSLNIATGGKLCIAAGASCTPSNINTFSGTVENRGVFTPQQAFSFGGGAFIDNYGTFTLNNSPNFNGAATITNEFGGAFNIAVDFNLNNGSTFNNYGVTISSGGGHNFSSNTNSVILNNGEFRIKGGNFNPQGPTTNNGIVQTTGQININGGPVYNKCRFVAGLGFNNNSTTFTNDGLVWVTATNPADAHIQNNGGAVFTNGPTGKLRGSRFTNSGTVTGTGEFYFTENTIQQGSFTGSSSTNPINFFDTSQTASQIFDIYNTSALTNVTRPASMVPGDTITWGTCVNVNYQQVYLLHSSIPLGTNGFPLPLSITDFKGSCIGGATTLTWGMSAETNLAACYIETSDDGTAWRVAGMVVPESKKEMYSYRMEKTAGDHYYRLRIRSVSGSEGYSAILKINCEASAAPALIIYPNPVLGAFNIVYTAADNCTVNIRIIDRQGDLMYKSGAKAVRGANNFPCTLPALKPGIYYISVTDNHGGRQVVAFRKN